MVFSQVYNDWNQHWECLLLIGLQNIEEVVILEEAHGSVCNLQMDATNALDDSLEQSRNEMFNLVNFTNFKNFLELGQEQSFLDAVGKRPKFEKSFEKGNSQSSILGQEEHGASKKLLIELRAGLDLVEGNDDVLEEDDVLISKWNCKTTDDTCQDVKKLSCTVELVIFVNESKKAFIHCLSNHLSSGNQFGVQFMKDVFQVISLNGLFGIKELQKFLHELRSDVYFQRSYFNCLINYKL